MADDGSRITGVEKRHPLKQSNHTQPIIMVGLIPIWLVPTSPVASQITFCCRQLPPANQKSRQKL
jgi:hypothetical protein